MAVAELAGLLAGCFADLKAASQARRLDATTYLLSVCRLSVSLIDSLSVCLPLCLSMSLCLPVSFIRFVSCFQIEFFLYIALYQNFHFF